MPSRNLSPRISTTVMMMSLLITMLSFFFLDRTSMAVYPSRVSNRSRRGLAATQPAIWADLVGDSPTPLSLLLFEPTPLPKRGRQSNRAPNRSHFSTLKGIFVPVKRLQHFLSIFGPTEPLRESTPQRISATFAQYFAEK